MSDKVKDIDLKSAAESLRERRKKESQPKPKIQRGTVQVASVIWQVGIIALDAGTAYILSEITSWMYAAFWLLAGAGGLLWSENQRTRIGNNAEQTRIGEIGVIVSIAAVLLGAVASGVVYMLGLASNGWVEAISVIVAVGLFFYHVFQARRYVLHDDHTLRKNEEALRIEEQERNKREVERRKDELSHIKELITLNEDGKRLFGDAWKSTLDYETPVNPTPADGEN